MKDSMKETAKAGSKTAAAGGAMLVLSFIGAGGAFVGFGTFLPEGMPRRVVVCVLGFVFAALFVAMLVSRLLSLFRGNDRFWTEIALATFNVALLLVCFAAIYRVLGIEDVSGSDGPKLTKHFGDCLYYSVVTFTTLGYGDFQPFGAARVMAALQAFLGYIVLGITASSGASIIQNVADKKDD